MALIVLPVPKWRWSAWKGGLLILIVYSFSGILGYFFIHWVYPIALGAASGVTVFILYLVDNYYVPRPPRLKPLKEPNLLIEYLKAKKRKICPLIEFV